MDFLTLVKKRYSARSYTDRKVEKEKLDIILESGRVAPSACNKQPHRVVVVRSEEGLSKLGKGYGGFSSPLALIICADHSKTWKRHDGKDSADIDASIVTDHMMLCATSLGLGSVWVCAFNKEAIVEEFNIPEGIEPINILFLGYAAGVPSPENRHNDPKCRMPGERTIFYETF